MLVIQRAMTASNLPLVLLHLLNEQALVFLGQPLDELSHCGDLLAPLLAHHADLHSMVGVEAGEKMAARGDVDAAVPRGHVVLVVLGYCKFTQVIRTGAIGNIGTNTHLYK